MAIIWNDFLHFVLNRSGMDVIDGLRAFVATATTGSFTSGAEQLGMSNRLTSKYVAELEARLGVRLLQRTTRRVGVTAAGEELLARSPALLDEFDAMLANVSEGTKGYSGTLRISAPVTFGEVYVSDLVSRFAASHPGLTIDLRLNDAYVDLAAEGIDLAFRIGQTAISSLKRRKLGEIHSFAVAAPDYLARHGALRTPADLVQHVCIVDTNRADAARWTFQADGTDLAVTVPTYFMVNSARVARDLAVRGHGIAYCPDFSLGDDLERGRLVRILPGYEAAANPISAVYLEGRTLPRKVRALIDFALEDVQRSGLV